MCNTIQVMDIKQSYRVCCISVYIYIFSFFSQCAGLCLRDLKEKCLRLRLLFIYVHESRASLVGKSSG